MLQWNLVSPSAGRVKRQKLDAGGEQQLRESAVRLLMRHLSLDDLMLEVRGERVLASVGRVRLFELRKT